MLIKGVSNWTQLKTCKCERYKITLLAASWVLRWMCCSLLTCIAFQASSGEMLLIWDGRATCWERRYISWVISSRSRDAGPSGFSLKCWGCSLDQHQNSCLWGQHHDLTARVAQNVLAGSELRPGPVLQTPWGTALSHIARFVLTFLWLPVDKKQRHWC